MQSRQPEYYGALARHFSALCGVPVTVVETAERKVLVTEDAAGCFFCDRCPNRCRLLSTLLYGCHEARRWNGRYAYYCPIGLAFHAVTVPQTDYAVLVGPVVMGEMEDTLLDLPDSVDKDGIRALDEWSAGKLSHLASLLEMAVYGLRYRPDAAAYDRNVVSDGEEQEETAVQYSSFPYLNEAEETLRDAVNRQDKPQANATLNELLRYVYAPHPEQFPLIKSRALQLVTLLMRLGGSEETDAPYRETFLPALRAAPSLEEMDLLLSEALHYFVDYAFDFSEIRHSDTIYRVMDHIKSNYDRKLTLEDIASRVYLSPSHVSGLFRRETGQTISSYINFIRIEKSKQLLRRGEISIAEIAARCGFEDQSYFTRVFKKQTGISPKKYRDNAGEDAGL